MKVFKYGSALGLIFILGGVRALRADTGIDGTAMTSSSFTFNGPVLISSLTISNNLAVSTITVVSSATATSLTVTNNLSIPNGVNSTDAGAYGQIGLFQTVTETDQLAATTTSSTYQASSTTVTITPKNSSHRIEITASFNFEVANAAICSATLYRNNTTNISPYSNGLVYTNVGTGLIVPAAFEFVDSPATTSATTYTIYFKGNTNACTYGINSVTNSITVKEIL
jgi:hypothetical protein